MSSLSDLNGTHWTGKAELWLEGDAAADVSDCMLYVVDGRVEYTWSFKGQARTGTLSPADDGVDFQDTFHSSAAMRLSHIEGSWALLDAKGTYEASEGPPWGWRVSIARRASGELVLQMTNIMPWGEYERAARMVVSKS